MNILDSFSVEVLPKTAAKIEDFHALFPPNTQIYIANVVGTPFSIMLDTSKRIQSQGFTVVPHLLARTIPDKSALANQLSQYQNEAGVNQLLLIAGGAKQHYGEFESTLDLLATGLFDKFSFKSLHFAGHPEVNFDIDPDRGTYNADQALALKQDFAQRTDAEVSLITQFGFNHQTVIDWLFRVSQLGIDLPVKIGVTGPTKIQTLLKYALACGVGASISVLQKKASSVTKLLTPFEPVEFLDQLSQELITQQIPLFSGIHFFPLGGIQACSDWIKSNQHRYIN